MTAYMPYCSRTALSFTPGWPLACVLPPASTFEAPGMRATLKNYQAYVPQHAIAPPLVGLPSAVLSWIALVTAS